MSKRIRTNTTPSKHSTAATQTDFDLAIKRYKSEDAFQRTWYNRTDKQHQQFFILLDLNNRGCDAAIAAIEATRSGIAQSIEIARQHTNNPWLLLLVDDELINDWSSDPAFLPTAAELRSHMLARPSTVSVLGISPPKLFLDTIYL